MPKICLFPITFCGCIGFLTVSLLPAYADTIRISPLCAKQEAAELAKETYQTIEHSLSLMPMFQLSGARNSLAPLGKCEKKDGGPHNFAKISSKYLIAGRLKAVGESKNLLLADLALFDVANQSPLIKERYQGTATNVRSIAFRFANRVFSEFTGKEGFFGQEIAFVANGGSGGKRELFKARIGNPAVRQLTEHGGIVASPSWSPKAKRIAYSLTTNEFSDLFFTAAKGGKPKQITRLPGAEKGSSFSQDGKSLLTSIEMGSKRNLAVFNLRGRLIKRLTSSAAKDITPSWYSNFRRIVFASNKQGAYRIYKTSGSGGKVREVKFSNEEILKNKDCFSPSYSPNGEHLAMACGKKPSYQIYLAQKKEGLGKEMQLQQLTDRGNNRHPSWSPDGQFLIFSRKLEEEKSYSLVLSSIKLGSPANAGKTIPLKLKAINQTEPTWSPVSPE